MRLSKYEQETIINFNAGESIASIYTCDKTVMRALDRLVATYPDTYRLAGQNEIAKTYFMPKTCITYRKPRKLTDEQREQKRALMNKINGNDNIKENENIE